MNQRIRELMDEATVIRKTFHGIEHIEFDKEKFAQLIVKECASLVVGDPAFILEHFGVEE